MANFVLTNTKIYVHSYDLTTHSNQVSLTTEVETVDNTTFGTAGYRSRRAGLRSVSAEVAGFHDDDPSKLGFDDLGKTDRVVTISPQGSATDVSYFFHAGGFEYETLGAIGEMNPFTLSMESTNSTGMVRGRLAKTKGSVPSGSTGAKGSAVNLGAGGAGKRIYVATHVFSAGTSLSLQIESSTTQGGTYAEVPGLGATDIGSFTTVGSGWVSADASSITDTWFRVNVTAITGAFDFAVSIGIQ